MDAPHTIPQCAPASVAAVCVWCARVNHAPLCVLAVGCSNWKRMFVVLNGLLPPTESSQRPSEDILRSAYKLVSLKPEEREWRLRKYFKFTMLRNPLERIVSAYRNKVCAVGAVWSVCLWNVCVCV